MKAILWKYAVSVRLLGIFLSSAALLCRQEVRAQTMEQAQQLITKQSLRSMVEALASPVCEGRSSGSEGRDKAKNLIVSAFSEAGLGMVSSSYAYGFYFWKENNRRRDWNRKV